MAQEETPVLIVGGSLVGLTSALLLGDLGVPSLVVERHPGTAIHARAGHFQLGTTEMLRQVGLERTVREASAKTYHPIGGIIAVESLAGKQLATFVKELNEGVEGFSPTVRVFIDQDVLEPILREKAVALGATVRNRVEATALEQDDDGATVTLHDLESGEEHTVRARYVIAADGNRSPMRTRLGIGMEGHGILSNSITIYFRADCTPLLEDRNQGVIYVHNPELRGFFRLDRAGKSGFLVINSVGADVTTDEAVNVGEGITEERAAAMLQTAIGTPDIPDGNPPDRPLEGRGELRHTHARRARVPGRRRRPRRAAQRRLRRQHGDPGRAQPRLEARRGHPRRGRDGAPRHLRGRAPPALAADRRAGVHALRHPGRARARHRRRAAVHRRPDDGDRARDELERRDRRRE